MLYKRTEGTLRTTHEIGSFLNKVTTIKKDYIKDMKNLIASYAQKKMLVNEHLDYSVKHAVETLVGTLEEMIQFEATFTGHLSDLSTEIEGFVKDKTARRQKLKSDGELMMKDLQTQYDTLKRYKATYANQAKDAEKQQAALVKASSDASVKTNKLAQMSTKTSVAIDKARTAENEYKDVVRQTNERQSAVYTREMPALLKDFQAFEEERVNFVHDKLSKYAEYVLAWPKAYEDAGNKCRDAAAAVSASADIAAYVQDNRTGRSAPRDISVEIIPGPHNNNATSADGSAPPSSPSSSSPQQQQQQQQGGAGGGVEFNMMSACEDLLKERFDTENKGAMEMAVQRVDSAVRTDESSVASLEKMAAAYGNDPARKKADMERDRLVRNIAAAKKKKEELLARIDALTAAAPGPSAAAAAAAVPSPAAAPTAGSEASGETLAAGTGDEGSRGAENGVEGGEGSGSSESGDNPEVLVRVKGIYDYEATCDTELSFKEGQEFTVTEQDPSGWWYATVDGKQGFVPANYVKVLDN